MFKRKQFIIGIVIISIAVSYLAYMGFASSATYYYTVGEIMEQSGSVNGDNVKVNGLVVADSVEKDAGGLSLKFSISDGEESLPVVYKGVIPDAFRDGSDVVVEGKLDSAGVFQADTLLTKCPSKYVPED